MIDAHWVGPKLWQGSAPTDAHDLSSFDVVVLCAREYQPTLSRVHVVRCPIDDGELSAHELAVAWGAASCAADTIRRGGRVLVTCYLGRNRSGLVTALTLHLVTGESGAACVARVQKQRPDSLQNPSFVRALRLVSARAREEVAPCPS